MTAYLAWWFAGGMAGMVAGLLVLRQRGALTWRAPLVYAAAILGCLYGAKVQYRLRFHPLLEALTVAPEELLAPGLHIPLGLALAFVAAMLACLLLRVPVLQMADALAMTGAAMMPIGRVGCLIAGCCSGILCPTWLSIICVRPSAAAGIGGPTNSLLGAASGAPHLAHSLPAYFALLGAATVALHVWLLRRRVAPGTLIAVGCLVYPLGHLAVEQLREAPSDRVAVMTTVLLGMIAIDALVLGWVAVRRGSAVLSASHGQPHPSTVHLAEHPS